MNRRAIVAAAVISLAVLAAFLLPKPSVDTATSDFEKQRHDYQMSLNSSEQRFEPDLYVIILGGRVYMRTDFDSVVPGYCRIRCGTVMKDDAYHISLPVGYAHNSNVVPDPTSFEPVTSLTYWNPLTRLVETTAESGGNGVVLPDVLKDDLVSADIRPGETMYTSADFVRKDSTGHTRMIDGVLAYEQLGHEYGYSLDTAVTRRLIGGQLVVKLPPYRVPLFVDESLDHTHTVPVVVTWK